MCEPGDSLSSVSNIAVSFEIRNLLNNLDVKNTPADKSMFVEENDPKSQIKETRKRKRQEEKNNESQNSTELGRRKKRKVCNSPPSSCTSNSTPKSIASKSQKQKKKYLVQNYKISKWSEQLIKILKEFLATHQWDAAAKILYTLTYEPVMTSEIIWKSGFQIFCNHPKSNSEILMQFARAVTKLDKIFVPCIILDCMIYFLIQGDIQGAKETLQLRTQIRRNSSPQNPRHVNILNILQGYEGMLYAEEWENLLPAHDEEMEALDKQQLDTLGNKAITKFEELFIYPGNWDIFVNKYLVIMIYNNKIEDAIATLQKYCNLNRQNPNSYIYLYQIVQTYHPKNKKLLSNFLQHLSFIDPSEELLMNMKHFENPNSGEYLKILFNMIDYPSNKNNAQLWNDLADAVKKTGQNPSEMELAVWYDLWKDRSDWWLDYHFHVNSIKIDDADSAEIHLNKAIAVLFFKGTDNTYVDTVRQKLSEMNYENALENLKHAELLICSVNLRDLEAIHLQKTKN